MYNYVYYSPAKEGSMHITTPVSHTISKRTVCVIMMRKKGREGEVAVDEHDHDHA